jgi:hypothetical protein
MRKEAIVVVGVLIGLGTIGILTVAQSGFPGLDGSGPPPTSDGGSGDGGTTIPATPTAEPDSDRIEPGRLRAELHAAANAERSDAIEQRADLRRAA